MKGIHPAVAILFSLFAGLSVIVAIELSRAVHRIAELEATVDGLEVSQALGNSTANKPHLVYAAQKVGRIGGWNDVKRELEKLWEAIQNVERILKMFARLPEILEGVAKEFKHARDE